MKPVAISMVSNEGYGEDESSEGWEGGLPGTKGWNRGIDWGWVWCEMNRSWRTEERDMVG